MPYQRSTGAPGFEPEASVLETEMLSGYTTLLRQDTLIPKAGIEPARDVAVTIVLQTTADPFGLFGLAFESKYRRDKKQRASHSQQLPERPARPKNPLIFCFGFSGAGTSAPARLLMPKEIDAGRAFNRTALLISASQLLSQHI